MSNGKITAMIGAALTEGLAPDYKVYYDHGKTSTSQNVKGCLALVSREPSNATRIADVDIAICRKGASGSLVDAILEIEESSFSPKTILGDISAMMLTKSIAIKLGDGSHELYTVDEFTAKYVFGVVRQKGSKRQQIEEFLLPQFRLLTMASRGERIPTVRVLSEIDDLAGEVIKTVKGKLDQRHSALCGNRLSEKLMGHTEHLLGCLLGLKDKYALLQPMIFDQTVQVQRGSGSRSRGFNSLRRATYYDCIQDVVNLAFDSDRRTPSITNVFAGLCNESALGTLRERFALNGPVFFEVDDNGNEIVSESEIASQRAERRHEFDEILSSVRVRWDEFGRQPWVAGFRAIRDKVTAHRELKRSGEDYEPAVDIPQLGIRWCDVGESIGLLEPLILDLYLLVRNVNFVIDNLDSSFKRAGRDFWT